MKINKKELNEVIFNIIKKTLLNEDRTEHDNGAVEIDNFDLVSRIVNFNSDDDVYFVEIIKRHKDNMNQYFAHNARDFITYYLFKSLEELNSKKEEIKSICNKTNSRAYIYLNSRSSKAINDYAENVLKSRFKRHRNEYFKQGHEIEVAAGQAKDWDNRNICVIDVDSNDENVYAKVVKKLKNANITPIDTYRSVNNGWHIIIGDKEKAKQLNFSDIDDGNNYGMFATVSLEIDKSAILYAKVIPNGYGLQQSVQARKANRMKK